MPIPTAIPSRALAELTYAEVANYLNEQSVLCLPVGAIEQHGLHLPLNTDVIIAEEFTRRICAEWGAKFDLWQLPTVAISLSREHDWAPGTLWLTVQSFAILIKELAQQIANNFPTRNLVIINAHGGNRGVLEGILQELRSECGLNTCVIHPLALSKVKAGSHMPDVHGGKSETSVMLALAPHVVRTPMPAGLVKLAAGTAIRDSILDRGVTWPWTTNDPSIAIGGVIGDANNASVELGEAILASAVEEARPVIEHLIARQKSPVAVRPIYGAGK